MIEPIARVTKNFNVDVHTLFDAWLDPNMIGQFMFGKKLRNETIKQIILDPKMGGDFSFIVERDGQTINHVGTYQTISRPHQLIFTWGVDGQSEKSVVMINFLPNADGSELALEHVLDLKWADFVPKVEENWRKMIETLEIILQENKDEDSITRVQIMSEDSSKNL